MGKRISLEYGVAERLNLIRQALTIKGYSEMAESVIDTITQYFGYEDYCMDWSVDNDIRSVFYDLEDLGILKRKEEYDTTEDWRTMYWYYDYVNLYHTTNNSKRKEKSVYASLSEHEWGYTQ